MKRTTLLLLALACWAQAEQPTPQQCKANLAKWVPMFKAAYADPDCQGDGTPSCPFVAPVKNLRGAQLSEIAFQAEACVKVDKKHRFEYQRVATRAENFMVMRAGNFIEEAGQSEQYTEWEQAKLKKSDH